MTRSTKTTVTASPLEAAVQAARETEGQVRQAVETLTAEVADLQAEHDRLAAEVESGSVVADTDRLDELAETILPRRTRRLEDLVQRIAPSAEQGRVAAELALAAVDGAEGLPAKDEAYRARRRELETVIATAVADLRRETDARDRLIGDLASKAFRAGLTDHAGDPLSRVRATTATSLRGSDYNHRDPAGGVLVDGTEFRPVGSQSAVQLAVAKADELIGATVAAAEHERWAKAPALAPAPLPGNRRR